MDIEWHYVASDGTDTWANSTNSGTPCSLDTALANVTSGKGLYMKAGTYTRSATDTVTADGTATSPIMMVGCDASWNVLTPSRDATTKLLSATNYPVISYGAGNYSWSANGADYWIYHCIKFVGARQGIQATFGASCYGYGCIFINNASNANAIAFSTISVSYIILDNCDFAHTGGDGICAVLLFAACKIFNSIVYDSGGDGIQVTNSNIFIANTLIYGHDDYGIKITTTTVTHNWSLYGVTIYGGKGIYTGDAAYTNLSYIGCCHITDGGAYAIQNPNATGSPIVISHNRLRDNVSGGVSWVGDYVYSVGGTDTATGDADTDYKATGSSNFTLKTTAPGVTLGQFGQPVGALPPGDWPLLTNVVSPETMNRDTGTFVEADRNTDPGESNVKTGTSYKILNVTKNGSYSASGGGGVSKSRVFGGL